MPSEKQPEGAQGQSAGEMISAVEYQLQLRKKVCCRASWQVGKELMMQTYSLIQIWQNPLLAESATSLNEAH